MLALELDKVIGFTGCGKVSPPGMGFVGHVGEAPGLRRWPGLAGGGKELSLQVVEFPLELQDIQVPVASLQSALGLTRDLRVPQEPSVGRLGRVVATGEVAAHADLLLELHHGLEEVAERPQMRVEVGQQCQLAGTVVAPVADRAAHDGVVLLFDEAVVVFLVGTAPGEGDRLALAVADELEVDELRAIIAVQPEQGEREPAADLLQGGKDMALGLVGHHRHLGPAGGHIGQGEREGVLAKGRAAVVGHQIDFTEAGPQVAPVGKGADGHMMLQEGPGPGVGAALVQAHLAFDGSKQPVERRGRGVHQELTELWVLELQQALALKLRHQLAQERDQPFAAEPVGESPQALQDDQERRGLIPVVIALPLARCPRSAAMPGHEDDAPATHRADLWPAAAAQDIGGVDTVVAGQVDELIEHAAPLLLRRSPEADREFSGDSLAFTHC